MTPSNQHPQLPLTPVVAERMAKILETWPRDVTPDNIHVARSASDELYPGTIEEHVGTLPLEVEERWIPGPEGATDVKLACYRPTGAEGPMPVLLYLHSGGLVSGNRFAEDLRLLELAIATGSAVVSVEYRLAPEDPYPAAIEDCYAVWQWVTREAADLNIDAGRGILVGESAGGGLAAALAILIRDRGGPQPVGQLLATPMLDHRSDMPSVAQMDAESLWNKVSNETGWTAYLGPLAGRADVPAHASASRVDDLSGLPPAFIDAGDAEIFRDEAVEYARRLWLAGVPAELHVWTGGCHTFYALIPEMPVAQVVFDTRLEWLRLVLGARAFNNR